MLSQQGTGQALGPELGSQYPCEKLGVMSQSQIRISGRPYLNNKAECTWGRQLKPNFGFHTVVHGFTCICIYVYMHSYDPAHTKHIPGESAMLTIWKMTFPFLAQALPPEQLHFPLQRIISAHHYCRVRPPTLHARDWYQEQYLTIYNLMVFKVTYDSWSERNNNIKKWSGKELSLLLLAPFTDKQLSG